MTTKDEALKLALEALEPRPGMPNPEYESLTQCAITAIREALAEQPARQQEPAGSVYRYGKDSSGKQWHGIRWTASELDLPDGTLIYTSQPASKPWVGLTSQDKVELLRANGEAAVLILTEAKLREKNA